MQGHIASVSAVDIVSLSHSISTGGSNICVPGNYLVLSASYAGDLKAWSWSEFAGELTCVGGIHDTGGRISAVHVLKLEVLDENKELYMLCMTGHSSGLIQTWTFSSNLKHLMKEPISSIVVHSGRVLSLHPTNIYTSCVSKNCILSTSADGSTAFLEITHEGKISVLQRYFSTGMTHATFVRDGNMEIEIFQIYDDRITSFLAASNCSLIPSHYRNENKIKGVNGSLSQDSKHDEVQDSSDPPTSTRKTSSASQFNLVLDIDDGLEPYKSIEPTQITPLSNRSLSTDVSLGQVNSLKIGHLSLKHLKHLTNREIWKADNQEFDALHDEINDEEVALPFFSEPQERSNLDNLATWNITLEVRVELQNAKKDKALLDYFRQNCITTKFPSEVITARDAAEILDRWVAEVIKNNTIGDTITKKQVLDIFAVLNVSENDLLDFLKVAKLGAVLVTIHKNMVKSEPFQEQGISRSENRLKKKFSQMRTTNTLISYNSMGEKVIQKRNLQISATAGIPNGYASVLRKIWSRTSTRVPYHLNGVDMIGYNQCTIMKNIPAHIKKLLNKKIKSPQSWSSRLEHFFDIKRAVRISRTLFDMRQNYQQEFIQNNSKVPSMSEIMITYFERNFGGDIQIAHLKVVHFLESLCQYSDFSLLNTLRYFIFSEEESNSRIQRYVWLYVESRRWLFLHCDIMTGGSVTATQGQQFKVGSLLEPSLTSCGTTLPFYLNWLLIQKSDTLLCLNEFLAIRGLYGPSIRENIQSVINHALVSSTHEDVELSTPSACYVDMEQFLEALIFETKKQDQLIMEVKEQIFGSIAIPHNTRNSSQMMTDESLLSTSLTRSNAVCMSLLNTLHEIQEMLQMFMGTDTERTGFTSSDTFKTVLLNCLNGTDLLEDQDGRDYCEESLQMKLFQECLTRYSSGDGSDAIGYIDFVALTMSWIYQQSEEVSRLHSGWILTAISSLRRGIDREQGKALLLFLASAQAFPSSADPYWMARNRRFESKMESGCSTSLPSLASINQNETSSLFQPQSKVISYLGNWNLASSIASDNPGVLTVQKVTSALPRKSLSEIALGVDGKEWKLLAKSTADGSCRNITIPTTNRELRTVHGEVCHHHLKFTTPHISSFELTSQIENMPLDIIFQPKSELIDGIRYDKGYLSGERLGRNLKSDHSSQHKSVSLHIPLKSKSATNILAPKMSDIPFSLDPNLDTSSTTNMQNNNCPHSEFASSSISLETGHISNAYGLLRKSANVYSPDAEEQSLENSLRDYETMRKMEEELLDDIDDAHLQMNIKLHEKYLAEKENQRRMKMKEQESMHFKELADEERMKRKQQALILEAKARALEEADRIAKEEETKKKQADIRAARAAQEAVKREKELLEAEIHRELLELQSMRKEERYSISVEKAIAERIAR